MNSSRKEFSLLIFGKKVLTVASDESSLKTNLFLALENYPVDSIKKKLFVYVMKFIVYCNIYMFFLKDDSTFKDFPELNFGNDISYFIVWPGEIKRKRAYLFELDDKVVSFTKLFFYKEGNIYREVELTKAFSNLKNKNPNLGDVKVLRFYSSEDVSFIKFEPLPDKAKALDKRRYSYRDVAICDDRYKRTIGLNEFFNLNPFCLERLKKLTSFPFLMDYLSEYGVEVNFIHGDYGSENIFIDSFRKFYVIDWERGSPSGPAQTDELAYFVGSTKANLKGRNMNSFYIQFKLSDERNLVNLLLASATLSLNGFSVIEPYVDFIDDKYTRRFE
ncbi:hypothetical protein BCT73_06570 [Vibrio breoganii]|uniref:hypothetical protein n=1 Tax=Vibrio breoganii TaxID=553239 RepID=UPI000C8478DE|nr:hypothetical protein [Vibrio breoganii]PML61249.1 hypothetical protein BCT73_06570 [Vibrio breoganii]